MKNGYLMIILVLTLSLLLMPLIAVGDKTPPNNEGPINSKNTPSAENKKEDKISVYITEKKEVLKVDLEEYLCGVVAAEMPAVYEAEALKTQAVCAFTYLTKKLKAKTDENDYDITDDYKTDQAYITKETRSARWGENFEQYEDKISKAVKAVKNKVITYNGEVIFAAYHAISAGKTEDAKNVWGGEYPYLKSVPSEGDLLAKDYLTEQSFTVLELENTLKTKSATPDGKPEGYIGSVQKSDCGTVLKITLCGTEFKGSEIREMFGLRSSNFELEYDEKSGFKFSVKGYGHGVGLSQNGANYLAQSGKTFEEIIKHYYSGTKIENCN